MMHISANWSTYVQAAVLLPEGTFTFLKKTLNIYCHQQLSSIILYIFYFINVILTFMSVK